MELCGAERETEAEEDANRSIPKGSPHCFGVLRGS